MSRKSIMQSGVCSMLTFISEGKYNIHVHVHICLYLQRNEVGAQTQDQLKWLLLGEGENRVEEVMEM